MERSTRRRRFVQEVHRLKSRINPLGRFVHEFAGSLDAPRMTRHDVGFRYAHPDFRHFCLLRAARVVSDLNAALQLAVSGFPQQVAVLHRTVHEFCNQIEGVIVQMEKDGRVSGKLAAFIAHYFEDADRGGPRTKQDTLSTKYLNELIGAPLDEQSGRDRTDDVGLKSAAEMHRNIAFVFSSFVHGRYPETMDLYGGAPGRFHVHGMKGTPKDEENLVLIDSSITTASLCFLRLVQGLNLKHLLAHDPMLTDWFRNFGHLKGEHEMNT
jgi:hypothetical protein